MNIIRTWWQNFVKSYCKKRIIEVAKSVGTGLYVGSNSYVTSNTELGDHVNFNGMAMSGKGHIKIGSYFHSGPGCQIITSFHKYEGEQIPYDNQYIDKDVIIGDCVWLGNNVIILGGCDYRGRSNYSGGICSVQRCSCLCYCRGTSCSSV